MGEMKRFRAVLAPFRIIFRGGWRCVDETARPDFVEAFDDVSRWAELAEKVTAFRRGLDAESLRLFDERLNCMRKFPSGDCKRHFLYRPAAMLANDPREYGRWKRLKRQLKKKYHLPRLLPEVFYYEHGLKLLPPSVLDYMAGKDFIDAGAFIGDSAIVLAKYRPAKIWCCEVSEKNRQQLRKTLRTCGLEDCCRIEACAIGDHEGEISFADIGGGSNDATRTGVQTARLETIDHLAEKNGLHVGLVKADVEGMGLDLVRGMTDVLKRDRPVLSIAIYHNMTEFFDIKPYIEFLDLHYRFRFVRLHPLRDVLVPNAEETLLAYPEELDLAVAQ